MSLGNFIDRDYLIIVSGQLGRFKQYAQSKWSFRCPFCGDSTKNPMAAHAYVFPNIKKANKLSFKCFKCGYSTDLRGLLKKLDESIYRQYRRALFQSSRSLGVSTFHGTPVPTECDSKKVVLHPSSFFVPLLSLQEDHPARTYIKSRKIPLDRLERIWWSEKFWETVKQLKPDQKVREGHDEGRIILPIMDPTNTYMVGLQGRSLQPDAKLRYVDCQIFKNDPYLFGQEMINRDLSVLIVEGPIDSLFLDNCVALCGATKSPKYLPENRIFYLDQEPRNPHIMKRYDDLVEAGETLVFLPPSYFEMDANEIIQKTGWSTARFTEFVKEHTYTGLRAKMKLSAWKRLTPEK